MWQDKKTNLNDAKRSEKQKKTLWKLVVSRQKNQYFKRKTALKEQILVH